MGHHAGAGTHGTVHHVASHDLPGSHPGLVHKTLHDNASPEEQAKFHKEVKNLDKVKQLAYSGTDQHGKSHIIMHAAPGVHLQHTETYKKAVAEGPEAVKQLKEHANKLAADKRKYHVDEHSMHHEYVSLLVIYSLFLSFSKFPVTCIMETSNLRNILMVGDLKKLISLTGVKRTISRNHPNQNFTMYAVSHLYSSI